jgi:LysM repeat protein
VRGIGLLACAVGVGLVATAGAPGIITIHKGDTLSAIAKANGTTVDALKQANGLTSDRIIAGKTLQLPGAVPATVTTVTTTATYTVAAGDNLTVLAKRFGTTVPAIKAANRLGNGVLPLGKVLVIPTTVQTVTGPTTPSRTSTAVVGATPAAAAANHRAVLASRPQPTKDQARALVIAAAKKHGVPTELALAVAYQESGFQQSVVSGVDAIGIMQVLPSTAKNLEPTAGHPLDLLKAEDNVTAGVLLLKQLLAAHGGDHEAAMAGYYQGAGSIARKGILPQTYAYIASINALKARFLRG